ncbi:hypothetical protein [Acidithiobacillus ferriphilus]|uniref:hypothetical protein n=1 Tax=Acidithiobacillus ferriphilus TaxID=1689834 RepID=UPI002DBAE889|nr:hypothetical protein [Acidithiobacillus ferriphilus]MEB8535526.1 hypothetical protein [Acidithiobacillus ferriphilus]
MITAVTMINGLANNTLPQFLSLIQIVAYMLGFWYVGSALYRARGAFYDSRITKESVVSRIFLGAALIVLPTFVAHTQATLFTSGNPSQLAYTGPGGASMTTAVEAIEFFVQVVGWFAITRGLMILKEVGDGTAGNGVSAKKGVTHILGGGLATSVVATAKALSATFGLTLPI